MSNKDLDIAAEIDALDDHSERIALSIAMVLVFHVRELMSKSELLAADSAGGTIHISRLAQSVNLAKSLDLFLLMGNVPGEVTGIQRRLASRCEAARAHGQVHGSLLFIDARSSAVDMEGEPIWSKETVQSRRIWRKAAESAKDEAHRLLVRLIRLRGASDE